jgi:membrane fusion protein (multidrug efflux system)
MLKRFAILAIALVVLFGGIAFVKSQQMKGLSAIKKAPPPAVVTSTQATLQSWQPTLKTVGTFYANQNVIIRNELPGTVKRIAFTSGSFVNQGDVLIQLEDTEDQAKLVELKAQQKLAKLDFERFSKLRQSQVVSQAQIDMAEAKLASANAQITSQQVRLSQKAISAPFSGKAGIRNVSVGQYLPVGTEIVQLQDSNPIYLDFNVNAADAQNLTQGASVKAISLGKEYSGKIDAIDSALDSTTRLVRVRASFDNPNGTLKTGMSAQLTIAQGTTLQVLTLPRLAISYAPYGDSVFLITKKDDKLSVAQKAVTTGDVIGDKIIIKDGLKADDQVVLTGHVKLRQGMAVTIDNTLKPATKK